MTYEEKVGRLTRAGDALLDAWDRSDEDTGVMWDEYQDALEAVVTDPVHNPVVVWPPQKVR